MPVIENAFQLIDNLKEDHEYDDEFEEVKVQEVAENFDSHQPLGSFQTPDKSESFVSSYNEVKLYKEENEKLRSIISPMEEHVRKLEKELLDAQLQRDEYQNRINRLE